MLGAILLHQHSGSILQNVHSRYNVQNPDMAGLLKLRIQSNHLFHIQYGIQGSLQTNINRTLPGMVQMWLPIRVTKPDR